MRSIKIFIAFILIMASTLTFSQVYKWVDSSGKVHFSDEKPEDTKIETLKFNRLNTMAKQKYEADEPRDGNTILRSPSKLRSPYKIKLHEVKIVSETESSLTIDFVYTYKHDVPAEEIKLFVLPDHSYWATKDVKIQRGTHGGRAVIGLSKSNMEKDRAYISKTTLLRFNFDHYQPKKYLGSIWGQDIAFKKMWKREREL